MQMQQTSLDAFESINRGDIPLNHQLILMFKPEANLRYPNFTCDELEIKTKRKHQTVSAAINRLMKFDVIIDSGIRRRTSSGRDAIAWRLNSQFNEGLSDKEFLAEILAFIKEQNEKD